MQMKKYIFTELEGLQVDFDLVIDGLSQAELAWRPAATSNPMGLILFHISRTEDIYMQELIRLQPQVWEKDGWYGRLNRPERDRGRHYNSEQVKAFVVPELDGLVAYSRAVRIETLNYLESLTAKDFDRKITTPRVKATLGWFFSDIVSHTAQHLGEMSYLRGLQRGPNR